MCDLVNHGEFGLIGMMERWSLEPAEADLVLETWRSRVWRLQIDATVSVVLLGREEMREAASGSSRGRTANSPGSEWLLGLASVK